MIKEKVLNKNRVGWFAVFILSALILLSSCNNVFETEIESKPAQQTTQTTTQPAAPAVRYATITGSIRLNGAYPAAIANNIQNNSQSSDRTANPVIPANAYYYVKATTTMPGKTGMTVAVDSTTRTYRLGPLEMDVPWTIEAGVRASSADDSEVYMSDISDEPVTLTESNSTYNHTFVLLPEISGAGTGHISLQMTVPDTVGSVRTECDALSNPAVSLDGTTATLTLNDVPSGSYEIVFKFMSVQEGAVQPFPLYTTVQTVNVFANMTTTTWVSEGEDGPISATGTDTFVLSNAAIQNYSMTQIYVGDPGTGRTALDSNEGGPYSPLLTFERALQKIEVQNKTSNDYTIHVSGSAAVNSEITTTRAHSITITGVNGTTPPELNGGDSGTVLELSTSVPVTLKNIKVTNGSSTTNGGGICLNSGSKLTLADGAVITGNSAQNGGGIYLAAGAKVTVGRGSVITDNTAQYGGGIACNETAYSESTEITISGGEIKSNTADSYGGGIYAEGCKFSLTYGTVHNNHGADGAGGVYVKGTTNAAMSGGSIYDNTMDESGENKGSEILLAENSRLTMTAGTVYNTAYTNNTTEPNTGVYLTDSTSNLDISGRAMIKKSAPVLLASNTAQVTIAGALNPTEDTSLTIALPTGHWDRGTEVLKAANAATLSAGLSKVQTWDPDFTVETKLTDSTKAILNADIFVAGSGYDSTKTSAGSATGRGTKSSPYDNLATAISECHYTPSTIKVNGNVAGSFTVPSTIEAQQITIKGMTGNQTDVLTGSSGSVITVENENINLIIKDLKITGGSGTLIGLQLYGGGIYIQKGTVKLAEGSLITGNTATGGFGGGVYLANFSSAKLFMYGTALIGKSSAGRPTSSEAEDYGNSASCGGGIFSDTAATVYLGCQNETDTAENAPSFNGGVCGNLSNSAGGGIYCRGSLKTLNGNISHNRSNNDNGGGLYFYSIGASVLNNITIEDNYAGGDGGGLYINENSTLNFSSGTISANEVSNTGSGGGVYVGGSFTMSGSAAIPNATERHNDVFLKDGHYLRFDTLSGESGVVASITPEKWDRGTVILQRYSGIDSLTAVELAHFETTDEDFRIDVASEVYRGVINADLYVVGSGVAGYGTPSHGTGVRGTRSSPFDSVAEALKECKKAMPYEIKIAGTVKGGSVISDSSSTLQATSVTLSGVTGNSQDILSGKNASTDVDSTTALKVENFTKPVIIKDLAISNGAAENGAGLYIGADAKVSLTDGALVNHNTATAKGGGVYVAADGTLFMYGKALIGDSAISTTRASGASYLYYSNKAESGGGIYNDGGSVYIGYDTTSHQTEVYSGTISGTQYLYGVRRNHCTNNGAGIFHNGGTLKIASGDISCNYGGSYGYGGAIYCGATATLSGGTITNNYGQNGGGLYIPSGKSVSVTGDVKFTKNEAILTGGAVYNSGSFTMTAGTIGGANVNSQSVQNTAGNAGGAVYNAGTFNVSAAAYVYPGTKKTNDVYLETSKVINVAAAYSSGASQTSTSPMTVTLDSYFRGRSLFTAGDAVTIDDDLKGLFSLSEYNDDWNKEKKTSVNEVLINSPIYVVSASGITGASKPDGFSWGNTAENGANGTKSKPFSTIQEALSIVSSDVTPEIVVAGTVKGVQTISGTINNSELKISGYIPAGSSSSDAVIDGNKAGSTLTVTAPSATFPITIEKLKITGGQTPSSGTDENKSGGGIKLLAGVLKLGDGAVITGNHSKKHGGGVYAAAGTSLCMYGTAIIGDELQFTATSTTLTTSGDDGCANCTDGNGGGIYSKGNVYIGYKVPNSNSTLYNGGKICRNCAHSGGGIYIDSGGSLYLSKSNVSFNYTWVFNAGGIFTKGSNCVIYDTAISNNKGSRGGGLYIDSNCSAEISGATAFDNNESDNGGAVNISSGATFTMYNGSIGSTTANTASTSGGAIYLYSSGTLNISEAAVIKAGSLKSNDVYLDGTSVVTICDSNIGNAENNKMTLTPSGLNRGTQVVAAGDSLTGGLTANLLKCFSIYDSDWRVVLNDSKGKMDADIWVASSGTNTGRASNVSEPPSSASARRGTKAAPFATIAEAVAEVWDTASTKTVDFTINISGSLSDAQTISSSVTNAKSIKLLGDENATKKEINGGGTERNGSMLNINTAVPVTIQNLKITGGKSTGPGGGIYVYAAKASLTLTTGAEVSGNEATSGGGIYIKGTSGTGNRATLIMNEDSAVYGNTANTGVAGGVYVYDYADMCMSGSARVGAATAEANATGDSGKYSNYATTSGGGIYVGANTNLFLGYSGPVDNNDYKSSLDGGVIYNYAVGGTTTGGGGIFNSGYIYIASGSVSYNGALGSSANGGGIYNATGTVYMYNGTIEGNKAASNGGGVYNKKVFSMSGGIIGTTAPVSDGVKQTAQNADGKYSNYANYGGGIYHNQDATSLSITGGTIEYNCSRSGGAGIYLNQKDGSIKGTDESHLVQVNYNYSVGGGGGVFANGGATLSLENVSFTGNKSYVKGGAIWAPAKVGSNIPVEMKGKIDIPYSGTKKNNDVCLGSAKSGGTYRTYVKVTGALSSSPDIVATLTVDDNLSTDYQYIQKEGNGINLEDVAGRFAMIDPSNPPQLYMMGGEGKPVVVHALSTANTTSVGKIVLNNGMVVSNTATLSTAMKEMAIAVIFYKGTGLNNSGSTQRILGVGLEKSHGPLWTSQAKCMGDSISGLHCTPSGSGGPDVFSGESITFSGIVNGSESYNHISSVASSYGETITFDKYTAVYFAKNYKYSTASHVSETAYENGWYIPSIAEVYEIYKNKTEVNNALSALGITTGLSGIMLSSSQRTNMSALIWGLDSTESTVKVKYYDVDDDDVGYYWPIYQFYPTN